MNLWGIMNPIVLQTNQINWSETGGHIKFREYVRRFTRWHPLNEVISVLDLLAGTISSINFDVIWKRKSVPVFYTLD